MTSLRMNTTACWLKTLQVILSQFDFLELSLNYTRFFSEDDSVPLAKGIQDIMTDLDFPTSLKSLSLAGFAYPLAKLIGKLTHAVNVKNLDISNIVDGPLTPVLAEQLSKALDLTVFIAWRVPINPEGSMAPEMAMIGTIVRHSVCYRHGSFPELETIGAFGHGLVDELQSRFHQRSLLGTDSHHGQFKVLGFQLLSQF